MAARALKGITWGHRRAIDPLAATLPEFHRRRPDIAVEWQSRSLHGFEFTPVRDLARSFDLVILDHPFAGDIARERCLLPLDSLFNQAAGEDFIGPSLATYRYEGQIWALPVDAACQVSVARPDLMARLGETPPRDWSSMMALGRKARSHGLHLAIGLRGVHSLMTFFSLCANQGRPCSESPDRPLADPQAAHKALDAMRSLLGFCPQEALDWNSIDLHDAMVARDDLVFCPAVYCYATYAEADIRAPLRFFDMPGLERADPAGSTIGGTGVGISAHCADPDAARAYVAFLGETSTQRQFALHHGQPARASLWHDPELDTRFGGCFSNTRATMEHAWTRPRYPGYLAFQAKAGDLIEEHLRGKLDVAILLSELERLRGWR
jgi:multiple sugar transport system substrate-binding protein